MVPSDLTFGDQKVNKGIGTIVIDYGVVLEEVLADGQVWDNPFGEG